MVYGVELGESLLADPLRMKYSGSRTEPPGREITIELSYRVLLKDTRGIGYFWI